jgi:uncharacterized protein YbjT (DUF2867 family)
MSELIRRMKVTVQSYEGRVEKRKTGKPKEKGGCMSESILVVGATGKTGKELVKLLVEHGERVRAATRNPQKTMPNLPGGAEPVEFDFERPQTFLPALRGVEKVFLMARPGDNRSDEVAMPFIDAAREEGVRHVVNLTAMGTEEDNAFMLRRLERYVEVSGIPYTHLRPNWFMQNFSSGPIFAEIRARGTLHLPASDGRLSFIDVRDIAAVGFSVLTGTGHTAKAYTLTGREALDHFEVAEKLSRAAGRTISYVPVDEETAREGLAREGVPEKYIARWAGFFSKVREGRCSPVTHDVELIIGRPATTFDQYVKDYAPSWR